MTTPKIIWTCKVGECLPSHVPKGGDVPMRDAVTEAYRNLVGEEPSFILSGWGGELDELERAVVEHRLPTPSPDIKSLINDFRAVNDNKLKQIKSEIHSYKVDMAVSVHLQNATPSLVSVDDSVLNNAISKSNAIRELLVEYAHHIDALLAALEAEK